MNVSLNSIQTYGSWYDDYSAPCKWDHPMQEDKVYYCEEASNSESKFNIFDFLNVFSWDYYYYHHHTGMTFCKQMREETQQDVGEVKLTMLKLLWCELINDALYSLLLLLALIQIFGSIK